MIINPFIFGISALPPVVSAKFSSDAGRKNAGITLSGDDLIATQASGTYNSVFLDTDKTTGKYAVEFELVSGTGTIGMRVGLTDAIDLSNPAANTNSLAYHVLFDGQIVQENITTSYFFSSAMGMTSFGEKVVVIFDFDNRRIVCPANSYYSSGMSESPVLTGSGQLYTFVSLYANISVALNSSGTLTSANEALVAGYEAAQGITVTRGLGTETQATPDWVNKLLTNLHAYYAGEDLTDSHGIIDLTQSGTVGTEAGLISDGLSFDGTNYAYAGRATSLTQDWTIAGWFRPDVANTYGMLTVYNTSWTSPVLILRADGQIYWAGSYRWTLTLGTGTLHHIAFTYRAGVLSIYLDGVLYDSASIKITNHDVATSMFLGRGYDGQADCVIDEVGNWDKALLPADITELYNAGAGLAYSSFDSGVPIYIPNDYAYYLAAPPKASTWLPYNLVDKTIALTVVHSGTAVETIMNIYSSASDALGIWIDNSVVYIHDDSNAQDTVRPLDSYTLVADTTYNIVFMVRQTPYQWRVLINDYDSGWQSYTNILSGGCYCCLGCRYTNLNLYSGAISEGFIYNRILNEVEIAALLASDPIEPIDMPEVTYLLDCDWTAVEDQSFTDSQVLDTLAEGVTTGSLTVKSSGLSVVGNVLQVVPVATSWTTQGLIGQEIAWGNPGRVTLIEGLNYASTTPIWMAGTHNAAALNVLYDGHYPYAQQKTVYANGVQQSGGSDYVFSTSEWFKVALIERADGFRFVAKQGGLNWILLYDSSGRSTDSYYPMLNINRSTNIFRRFLVTETLFPELLTGTDFSILDWL
jgi:hypothetical protein